MSERRERLDDLRADRALYGLESGELGELSMLLDEFQQTDSDDLERAAAALDLSLGPVEFEPVPDSLRQRLDATAAAWSAGIASAHAAASTASGTAPEPPVPSVPIPPPAPALAPVPSSGSGSGLGWWAAAAAVVLALAGWWPRMAGDAQPAGGDTAALAPTISELRGELAAASDALSIDWTATDFATGATGDVIWSQSRQEGFMRFEGLAVNDPGERQYQLWIFDEDQEHPVDGGVFDVPADGELIVPIDPKLVVSKPTLFAITIEKPGGVVVSDQERIALVGQV